MLRGSANETGTIDWCTRCERDTLMIAPEAAAAITEIGARAIYRLIELGQLHFVETTERTVRICAQSLNTIITNPHSSISHVNADDGIDASRQISGFVAETLQEEI